MNSKFKSRFRSRRNLLLLLSAITVFFLGLEIFIRTIGLLDFPIYDTDSEIGYVPKPNQSGAYLNKNRWVINDRNMNTSNPWNPSGNKDILLIGDSIVWGGNSYDQPEKLGEQLQSFLVPEWKVWPVSAGSWSVENVGVWLERNADIAEEIDYLVWVINAEDFGKASQWRSELTHPKSKPDIGLMYVIDKFVTSKFTNSRQNPILNPKIDLSSAEVFKLQLIKAHQRGTKCVIMLYPDKSTCEGEPLSLNRFLEFQNTVESAVPDQTVLVDVRKSKSWQTRFYRDGIHPSKQGNQCLASLIREILLTK